MNPSFPRNLLLVGFMGSGKSSVGRLLAAELDYQFVDTDAMVVQEAGVPISEIFARDGEEEFRRLETAALRSLVGSEGLIIATGGGIVTRGENLPVMREIGLVVCLTADEETIFERVSRNNRRPLLQTPNPRQTIADLLAVRRPLYVAAAERVVDTTGKSHAEVAAEVLSTAGDGEGLYKAD